MFKKVFSIIVMLLIAASTAVPVFADVASSDKIDKKIYLKDLTKDLTKDSKENKFLVTITRPENDEFTYKKSYVISGFTSSKDSIRVRVLKFNETKKEYEPFLSTEEEKYWDIGASGIFMKEFALTEGANKIRIVAYKKADEEKLTLGTNLQANDFTITYLNQDIKDKIVNSFKDIIDNIFGRFSTK